MDVEHVHMQLLCKSMITYVLNKNIGINAHLMQFKSVFYLPFLLCIYDHHFAEVIAFAHTVMCSKYMNLLNIFEVQ